MFDVSVSKMMIENGKWAISEGSTFISAGIVYVDDGQNGSMQLQCIFYGYMVCVSVYV